MGLIFIVADEFITDEVLFKSSSLMSPLGLCIFSGSLIKSEGAKGGCLILIGVYGKILFVLEGQAVSSFHFWNDARDRQVEKSSECSERTTGNGCLRLRSGSILYKGLTTYAQGPMPKWLRKPCFGWWAKHLG